MSFKSDFAAGMKKESSIYQQLKVIDPTILQTTTNCVVDYISDKYIFELKSRNCKKDTYPTTIVGYNKLLYADKQKKELVLLFAFTDGLYYCKYTPNLKYKVKKFVRNARSDYNDQIKDYVFIGVDQLKHFSTFKY